MSKIGSAMFKGAGIGAGTGAVTGGIAGGIVAHKKIKNLPMDTVTLNSYEKPLMTLKKVKGGSARGPVMDPKGNVVMEKMPQKTVSGHGKAIVSQKNHDIKNPVRVDSDVSFMPDADGNLQPYFSENTVYEKVGQWSEPTVKFETGISKTAHIIGGAAIGAVAGAAGGAIIGAAIDNKNKV